MNTQQIEDQIQALMAHAEPLRALDDDDEAKAPLGSIVDQINKLRAKQAGIASAEELRALSEGKEIARGIENMYGRKPNPGEVAFFQGGRPALEAQAKALGISFDGRNSDAKLAERIAEAAKS